MTLGRSELRQLAGITAGAIAIFVALQLLPIGTNLSHMDFRIDAKGASSIEFCDPLNPQFIPVVAVRSPVTMTLAAAEPAVAGREVRAAVRLRTGSGTDCSSSPLGDSRTRRWPSIIAAQ